MFRLKKINTKLLCHCLTCVLRIVVNTSGMMHIHHMSPLYGNEVPKSIMFSFSTRECYRSKVA